MAHPKRVSGRTGLFVLALVSILAAPGAFAFELPGWASKSEGEPTLAPVVKRALPAIVNISTVTHIEQAKQPLFQDPFFRRFFQMPKQAPQQQERQSHSLGSGVIVDAENGYVLTNHHVIDKADEISVTLKDGRHFEAKRVGSDPEADIAVLKIDADDLVQLPMGKMDGLEVGDLVIAIGNPFGLGQTVTSGIVSALGRTGLGIEGYEDFIQTDASINPGNSGGALIDWKGRLVGINTAIVGPSGGNVGIGFAIPVDMVKGLMQQIIEHGKVSRGELGVYIQKLTPDLIEALDLHSGKGALVAKVMPGSPAQKAGLKQGDVITSVNGKSVADSSDLHNRIGMMAPGTKVRIDYVRDGDRKNITVALGERTAVQEAGGGWRHEALPGALLEPIPEDKSHDGKVNGVMVGDVEAGSAAAKAGLREGDIIDRIDRHDIKNQQEARQALDKAGDSVLLRVIRGDGAMFLVVRR